MAFLRIKNFLKNFEFLKPPEKLTEKEVKKILGELFPFLKKDCEMKIKEPIIFISVKDQAVKNEVFLHQRRILEILKEKFPTYSFQKLCFNSRFKGLI